VALARILLHKGILGRALDADARAADDGRETVTAAVTEEAIRRDRGPGPGAPGASVRAGRSSEKREHLDDSTDCSRPAARDAARGADRGGGIGDGGARADGGRGAGRAEARSA